jgi:exo-beta-1,3-glucanase (GH17 family)
MNKLSFCQLAAALWCSVLAAQTNSVRAVLIEDMGFIPSGWMGDAATKGALQIEESSTPRPNSPQPHSQQWTYRPKVGRNGWAGVAWQFPEGNWGETLGRDWSNRAFSRVTVWARGVRDRGGNLPKLQFKAGGNTNPDRIKYPHQASFEAEGDFVTLTEEWKQYSIDLKARDFSQIVSAFAFVVRALDNRSDSGTFYLDDIEYRQDSEPSAKFEPPSKSPASRFTLPSAVWVAYAPTHFEPNAKPPILPSEGSIRADLRVLRNAGFDGLVTYGAEFPAIPRIAESVGFGVMLLGVWAPQDAKEMRLAREAARSPIVFGIIVGNEGLTFNRYALPGLHEAMEEMRRETGKPVSTTEIIESYSTIPELAEWSDFLAVNAHAYFHEIRNPVAAVQWTANVYAKLSKRYPDKPLLFKEVGLPTAAPGLSEKAQYDYYRALQMTPVKFVFFEAFDALYKNGPVEQSWGIFHADRTPKPAAALARTPAASPAKPRFDHD